MMFLSERSARGKADEYTRVGSREWIQRPPERPIKARSEVAGNRIPDSSLQFAEVN